MKKAVFPGTFDPFTIGHYNLVVRGLNIFDEIIVAIGINQEKQTYFDLEKRLNIIHQTFSNEPRVKAVSYSTLTADFAASIDASFILRGIRSVADFEYEHTIAATNKNIAGVETVILFTEPEFSFISSTIIRDLLVHKKDVCKFLPPNVNL